jgi:hypothetical protein
MKNLIESIFKIFSVTATTITTTILLSALYAPANDFLLYTYIGMGFIFGTYYSFIVVPLLEINRKYKAIIALGFVMAIGYISSTNWVYDFFVEQENKKIFVTPEYKDAVKIIEETNLTLDTETAQEVTFNRDAFEAKTLAYLKAIKYKNNSKKVKTDAYKTEVKKAVNFRTNAGMNYPINSVEDLAYILTEKESFRIENLNNKNKAKTQAKNNATLAKNQARKNAIKTVNNLLVKARENAPSKERVFFMLLALGFFVEIILNAVSVWLHFADASKEHFVKVPDLNLELWEKIAMENNFHGRSKKEISPRFKTFANILAINVAHGKDKISIVNFSQQDVMNFDNFSISNRIHFRDCYNVLEGKNPFKLTAVEAVELYKKYLSI